MYWLGGVLTITLLLLLPPPHNASTLSPEIPITLLSPPPLDRQQIERELPAIISPFLTLLFDFLDSSLLNTGLALYDGDGFKLSKLVDDVRGVVGTPHGRAVLYQAMLPMYVNYCGVGTVEGCRLVKAEDFVKPVLRVGQNSLEEILEEHKKRCEFIDFSVLHQVHPKRLSKVLFPVQLILLRVMETLSSVSAQEYRNLFGRMAESSGAIMDVIGYVLQTALVEESDQQQQEQVELSELAKTELSAAINSLLKTGSFDLLSGAVKTHGLDSVVMYIGPMLTQFSNHLRANYNILLSKPKLVDQFVKRRSSPHHYLAFILKVFGEKLLAQLGLDVTVDLSRVHLDVGLEVMVGCALDFCRLLYAIFQRLIERDASQWLTDHPDKQFDSYVKHILYLDHHLPYPTDNFHSTFSCVLSDERSRNLIAFCCKKVGQFLDLIHRTHFWPKQTRQLVIGAILDYQKARDILPEPEASLLIHMIDRSDDLINGLLRYVVGQSPQATWTSYFQEKGVSIALNQVNWFELFTIFFGFRLNEYETIYKMKRVFMNDPELTSEERQRIVKNAVPLWSLMYNPNRKRAFLLEKWWTALAPMYLPDQPTPPLNQIVAIDEGGVLVERLLKVYSDRVLGMRENKEPHPSFSALLSLPLTLLSIATTFGLESRLADMITSRLSLPSHYQPHLATLLSDFASSSSTQPRPNSGVVWQVLSKTYSSWSELSGTAGGWISFRLAAVKGRERRKPNLARGDDSGKAGFGSSLWRRDVVRTVLVGASIAFVVLSVRLLSGHHL